jgi:hypothetical protein
MAYTTINKGSSYFNTVTYTGNGTNPTSITSVGFKPDWLWIKCRSDAASHCLFDAVRGPSKRLISNSTAAESTETQIASFDTNGWTMDADTANNGSGRTYVAWNWLSGNTSGSSNTSGTITSTVTTNQTAGFSILTYTGNGTSGATVGHGLGNTPACYIVKGRNTAGTNWSMYHQSLGNTKAMVFTATAARTSSIYWNNTSPTSSVFSLGNDNDVNVNTQTYVAYCFNEIKGYSKFGSYTGNGSADGPFVYTGFKPAFVMVKSSSNAFAWVMHDSKRPGYNATNLYLYAQATNTEGSDIPHDFVSNGFKIRSTFSDTNGSGMTYIYMAFAENPFVSSTQIPTTAR